MTKAEEIRLISEKYDVIADVVYTLESQIKSIEEYDMYYKDEQELDQWQIDSNERSERRIKIILEIINCISKMK